MKIALNAHLLSKTTGYRTAGIHGYIYHLLRYLPANLPDDWHLSAFVGKGNPHQFNGIRMVPSRLDTESPLKRIIWEQGIQPFQLRPFDLYHALAFVSPFITLKPSVVTVYDLSFIHYPQVLSASRRLYLRWLTALSCHKARRVIAISESTAHDLHHALHIPQEKIIVAPCGYNADRFKPLPDADVRAFKQKMNLPERFWLFVGTLEPRKNLITLINAYAQLAPHERLPLVIGGGKGWLYADIFEAVERHNLTDSIRFIGFVPDDALALWYNSAEAFLYPSVFEGFGLPVLEAMACGTPVVISDASSLPEVAGEAGLRLPPLDVNAWAHALRTITQDSAWRTEASSRGLIEARRYNWNITAQQTIQSYLQALNE